MVTFAVMCPGLQSVESLEAMSKAASRYGVIARHIKTTDEVLRSTKKVQEMMLYIKAIHIIAKKQCRRILI